MLSCFGDSQVREEALEAALPENGDPAARDRKYFGYTYVCPDATACRERLFEDIAAAAEVTTDLRLDDIGIPRPEYHHCERCERAFADGDHDDRWASRNAVVMEFVREASERVPGCVHVTLSPDPCPGHLGGRADVGPQAPTDAVGEFVAPL